MTKKWFSVAEVAEMLGFGETKVRMAIIPRRSPLGEGRQTTPDSAAVGRRVRGSQGHAVRSGRGMTRRHNGEGSIYPYRNGFAAHVWITTPEGRRQRKVVYGKTREQVHEKWLALQRARETIAADIIKVLEISDVNTTGLTGPVDDPTSVFTALVKGDGVTNKADATSAGSYGIGKNAAYAVSDLQTVIYSSRFYEKSSGETKFAAQGRLRLISHTDGDKKLSAEGYWGNPGFAAIENESEVPHWITRSDIGTSIFAVGFREQDNWVDRMALSLATNFFLAIDREQIEFSLKSGSIQINQPSLDGILASANIEQAAKDNDQLLELERARRLIRCIRSDAATRHRISRSGTWRIHPSPADC